MQDSLALWATEQLTAQLEALDTMGLPLVGQTVFVYYWDELRPGANEEDGPRGGWFKAVVSQLLENGMVEVGGCMIAGEDD